MKYKIGIVSALALNLVCALAITTNAEIPFAPNVDLKTGSISVPSDYTRWATLGTWAHANTESPSGSHEYHVVYTQPETINYYKKNGRYPDGAVLVKELLYAETMPMTTGPAISHATKIKGWFVLVRDTQGRFKNSKLWGDGWGWSFFNAFDSQKTVSTDYQKNCLACHLPARDLANENAHDEDKWVYTLGYPILQ
jgi:hypothetical protein